MEKEQDVQIEREIIIGMIVNDEVCQKISKVLDKEAGLQSSVAKRLVTWIKEYHDKYSEAPRKNIDQILNDKIRQGNVPKDLMEEIEEDILPGLDAQYKNVGEINAEYLLHQAEQYFKKNYYKDWTDKVKAAADAGEFDEAERLRQEFKPISLQDNQESLIKAGDLYDMEITGPNWLVKGLLPKGLTIMGAWSGYGKSYCVLNLAMALVQRKKKVFGHFSAQPGQVLYLSLEDDKRRLQKRMRQIDPDPDREALNKNLMPAFEWSTLRQGGLNAIKDWIVNQKNPKLIVVDVLAHIWNKNPKTSGSGIYAEEYKIMQELKDLLREYDISMIVLTHTTKAQATDDVFQKILGGVGMQAAADNKIVIEKENGAPNLRRLSIRGKDIPEMHLLFETEGGEGQVWKYIGEAGEVQSSMEQQALYELLANEGAMAFKDIKQAATDKQIGISPNSVNTVLRKMIRDGVLEQLYKRGPYAVKGIEQNSKVAERLGRKRP